MDDLKVCAPPNLERDIDLLAQINYVGSTSMEVGIRIEHPGSEKVHLGSCYFTMVAKQTTGTGSAVLLPLRYTTPKEEVRAERAALRRKKRRAAAGNEPPPTPEEWSYLFAEHQSAIQNPGSTYLASDLVLSTWDRTYPSQENVPQTIFGGYLLHRAYVSAHLCAEMAADQRALLVAATRINFYEPVRMGDKLHFLSRVTYTGHSSVSVETEIVRVSRDRTRKELSNTCVFTFVNVDQDLNLLPVLHVTPASFIEDARYLAGRRRHVNYRSMMRGAGSTHPSPVSERHLEGA
jgi:acyl-CoA hydrolase